MADTPAPKRQRVIHIGDLRRVVEPFPINETTVGTGDLVSISSGADATNIYLDGNVYQSAINLVPSRLAPYTGTRWQVRLNDGGTWSFLNQGNVERMLAGSGSGVTLGRRVSKDRFDTTRWLMYRDLTGFRLRPCMQVGGWLAVDGGATVLVGHGKPVGRWLYWDILPFAADE